jgi:hypothetical protein
MVVAVEKRKQRVKSETDPDDTNNRYGPFRAVRD